MVVAKVVTITLHFLTILVFHMYGMVLNGKIVIIIYIIIVNRGKKFSSPADARGSGLLAIPQEKEFFLDVHRRTCGFYFCGIISLSFQSSIPLCPVIEKA